MNHIAGSSVLPGQEGVLQLVVSSTSPMQGFPHLLGGGSEHNLVLFCSPPPQLLLQGPHVDQGVNLPFTVMYKY